MKTSVQTYETTHTSAEFEKWLNHGTMPQYLHEELKKIQGDDDEIYQRFGQSLKFGTGGMRGILGPGPNRMNIYTVRKATFALGTFLLRQDSKIGSKGVAVGYDSRHRSAEFAEQVGLTLAQLGIQSFISPYLCPTPEVSFTVRRLHTAAGVMITASHNPPEYNGYKVYGPDGCQFLPEVTSEIRKIMDEHNNIFSIQTASLEESQQSGLFHWTDENVRAEYVRLAVNSLYFPAISSAERDALNMVYTPLHGTGRVPVTEALRSAGYSQVHVVEQQAQPDPNFSTVVSPNPGAKDSLNLAVELAGKVNADIVLGTDPDCDRVGVAVPGQDGRFHHLNGNQTGALLADFLLNLRKEEGNLPSNAVLFKTVVTSDLGRAVANSYHVSVENTLTGFKYIGHRATEYELTGEHTFIMGYEESYGYLLADMVRDKDGVQACLGVAQMAAYYKARGITLLDRLEQLFDKFGRYSEITYSIPLQEGHGTEQREQLMNQLRSSLPDVPGLKLVQVEDYMQSKRTTVENGALQAAHSTLDLPSSNVLKYLFSDGSWMAIRPSGTEPKMKVYLAAHGDSEADNKVKLQNMKQSLAGHLQVK